MTTVVSLLNMKGGVGKTSLSYNLSWFAAYDEALRVLVVDLDPQANVSQHLMGEDKYEEFLEKWEKREEKSIVDVFENNIENKNEGIYQIMNWTDKSCIHLIPSQLELSSAFKNPAQRVERLERYLSKIKDDYHLIIIDCPPTDSILTVSSYKASDFIVIPLKLEKLATIGLPLLKKSVDTYNNEYTEEKVEIAGILLNDVPHNQLPPASEKALDKVKSFASEYGWDIFDNYVRHSISYLTSTNDGTFIKHTKYARSAVIDEFISVGKEFLRKIGL